MPAAMPREKGDPFPGKLANDVRVRRAAPWGFDGVLFVSREPGHVIETTASDDSNLSVHFETRRTFSDFILECGGLDASEFRFGAKHA